MKKKSFRLLTNVLYSTKWFYLVLSMDDSHSVWFHVGSLLSFVLNEAHASQIIYDVTHEFSGELLFDMKYHKNYIHKFKSFQKINI